MILNIAMKLIRALMFAAANCLFLKCPRSSTGCFAVVSILTNIMKNTMDDINKDIMKSDPQPFPGLRLRQGVMISNL